MNRLRHAAVAELKIRSQKPGDRFMSVRNEHVDAYAQGSGTKRGLLACIQHGGAEQDKNR